MARTCRSVVDRSIALVGAAFLLCILFAIPSPVFAQTTVAVDSDVLFANHGGMDLTMDIAYPKEPEGVYPALIYISGSGWGHWWGWHYDRHQFDTAIELAASHGYVAASVDYRPTSTASGTPTGYCYPAQLIDVRSAVRWLRAHASQYHIDVNHVGAIGWSSGGHLALMLGLLPETTWFQGERDYPLYSSSVEAVASIAGATDLGRLYEETSQSGTRAALFDLLGGRPSQTPYAYRAASPLYLVTGSAPAILLIHGSADRDVPLDQSSLLFARLKGAGAKVSLVTINHGFHSNYFMQPSIIPFFDSVLKAKNKTFIGTIESYLQTGWSRLSAVFLLRTR